jgi:signal transduction histidine kinase/predicted RNA-binding protein with RPS1 domain
MNWDETLQFYKIGQIVTAQIDKMDHAGIHSKLSKGVIGYTKRSEAMLTRRVINLHQYFQIGQKVSARIIGFNSKYNTVDLSISQAQEQPWDTYIKTIANGDFIFGDVIMLTESKAIIEIIPGVIGVLPRREMWMHAETVDQILMVDDKVRLQVIGIEEKEKSLQLSARGLFAEEKDAKFSDATFKIEEKLTSALQIYRWQKTKKTRNKFTFSKTFRSKFNKIYVFVDNAAVAKSLIAMLQSFNINSEHLPLQHIDQNFLAGQKELVIFGCHSGAEFDSGKLKSLSSKLPVLILGTAEVLEIHKEWLIENNLGSFLLKLPHSAEQLVCALNDIAGKECLETPTDLNKLFGTDSNEYDENKEQDLSALLLEIKALTGASNIAIFQLNLNTMETEVYASTLAKLKLSEFDRGHLQFSPISDVIVDHDFVFEEGGGFNFKYMKPLGCFEALVGIRINLLDDHGYGLFFIGEHAGQFKYLEKRSFNFCELAVRSHIQHNKLLKKTTSEQKFLLTGKMAFNFMHEIKNQIQAMEYWLEILRTDSIMLNTGKLKGTDKAFMARFEQCVDGAQEAEKRTRNVEELFLTLLKSGDKKQITFVNFLGDFVNTILPIAARLNIKAQVNAPKSLTVNINLSQLNQLLVNLFLNSMDFIPLVRKQTGEIAITAYREKESELPVKIEFSDNGPGVNERNREKIFELLYTTKKGGSGLGLAISKKLAEEMGGKLSVKDTIRLNGVTFLLELPQN